MKTKSIIALLIVLTNLYSCCTDCEPEGGGEFSTIYEEKSFPGFLKVNGADIIPSEISSTNNSANDQATLGDISGQNLQNFSVRMFVPTDNSVTIEAQVGDIYILKNDGNDAPPFFEGGTIDGVSDEFGEGIDRQGYTYRFTYPNNAPNIDRTNLRGFYFEFHFVYTDTATGEILENKTFEYTVNLKFN